MALQAVRCRLRLPCRAWPGLCMRQPGCVRPSPPPRRDDRRQRLPAADRNRAWESPCHGAARPRRAFRPAQMSRVCRPGAGLVPAYAGPSFCTLPVAFQYGPHTSAPWPPILGGSYACCALLAEVCPVEPDLGAPNLPQDRGTEGRPAVSHGLTNYPTAISATARSAATTPAICARVKRSSSTSRASSTVMPG